jgi:hypothetical protein
VSAGAFAAPKIGRSHSSLFLKTRGSSENEENENRYKRNRSIIPKAILVVPVRGHAPFDEVVRFPSVGYSSHRDPSRHHCGEAE